MEHFLLGPAAIIRGTAFWGSPSSPGAALEATVIISTLFAALYLGTVILFHWGLAPRRQLASLMRELAPSRTDRKPTGEAVGAYK